jgi:hypothetical protein
MFIWRKEKLFSVSYVSCFVFKNSVEEEIYFLSEYKQGTRNMKSIEDKSYILIRFLSTGQYYIRKTYGRRSIRQKGS